MNFTDLHDLQPHELTADEAREVLSNFLAIQRQAFQTGDATSELGKFDLEYSRSSALRYLEKVLSKISFVASPHAESVPDWVAGSRMGGAKILTSSGAIWLARAAYYFGESLVRASNRLDWDIGAQDTAFASMPVVKGFAEGQEASVISICKNLALRVNVDEKPFSTVTQAVEYWFNAARAE